MSGRVVIAGASGFIGQFLVARYRAARAEVTTIGRSGADLLWTDPAGIQRALDGADVLVNLAGRSVNCRYNEANRNEILRSRIDTTRALSDAILGCASPPPVWLNASTATIYRHAEDRPMTESTGESGEGFSVSIATTWEHELFEADLPSTRRVALRMAIVVGDGSVMIPLVRLARFGLGGAQWDGRWFSSAARRAAGTFHRFGARFGRQKFSWIHIADVASSIDFIVAHPELEGVVNLSSPNPTDNVTLMRTLRRVLHIPIGLPAPRLVLEVGSAVIGTETELVLKSRWVVPERLLHAGFVFEFPELEGALRDVLEPKRSHSVT